MHIRTDRAENYRAECASYLNESSYYCNLYNLKIALDGIHRDTHPRSNFERMRNSTWTCTMITRNDDDDTDNSRLTNSIMRLHRLHHYVCGSMARGRNAIVYCRRPQRQNTHTARDSGKTWGNHKFHVKRPDQLFHFENFTPKLGTRGRK